MNRRAFLRMAFVAVACALLDLRPFRWESPEEPWDGEVTMVGDPDPYRYRLRGSIMTIDRPLGVAPGETEFRFVGSIPEPDRAFFVTRNTTWYGLFHR